MLKKYVVYDNDWNILEIINSNRKPNSKSMLNVLGEDRLEVLEILDEEYTVMENSYDENGEPVLDENDEPVVEEVTHTRKKLAINEVAKTQADVAKAAAEEVKKMNTLKEARNNLLKQSDEMWIEAKSQGVDATAIETYKQALRDWPENEIDLDNPTTPTKP